MVFSLTCPVCVLVWLKYLLLAKTLNWDRCLNLNSYFQLSSSVISHIFPRLLQLCLIFPRDISMWLSSRIARLLACNLRASKSIKAEDTRPFYILNQDLMCITSVIYYWLKTSPDPRKTAHRHEYWKTQFNVTLEFVRSIMHARI